MFKEFWINNEGTSSASYFQARHQQTELNWCLNLATQTIPISARYSTVCNIIYRYLSKNSVICELRTHRTWTYRKDITGSSGANDVDDDWWNKNPDDKKRVKNKIEENYGDIDVWEHATKIHEAANIFTKPLE